MFIGRTNELERIKRRLKLDQFNAILVYGRRRVGKTALINEAIKQANVACLSLLARDVSSSTNLSDFTKEAGEFMHLVGFNPTNFYEFFAGVMEYSKEHPFVLFIDEYSFLRSYDVDIDSYLQKAIELHGQGAKLTIILCGSYIRTMQGIIEKDAPLYHRFNEEILLHAFDYHSSSQMMGHISNEEKFLYYATFGGTAFNLKNIDYSLPFEKNLINEFIKSESFFEKEAVETIRREVIKDSNANTILELISHGKRKHTELNNLLGEPSKDNVTRYLKQLEEMDLIDKSFVVNNKSDRKSLYHIKDNLLDFYYTYLFKYIRLRNIMKPEVFFEHYIKKDFYEHYLPRKFEEVVKEYLIKENGLSIPLFTSVGRLYYRDKNINREFDVVLASEEGLIPIECKYSKSLVTKNEVAQEIHQWDNLPFKIYRFGFASKNGFSEAVLKDDALLLLTLDDLYK